MYFSELKNRLEKISPLAYQRVVLKCIEHFKKYEITFSDLMNPKENDRVPDEIVDILNEKILELYDIEIFV